MKKTLYILVITYSFIASDSYSQTEPLLEKRDSSLVEPTKREDCKCSPSLPIEIAATQLLWGFPDYWLLKSVLGQSESGPIPLAGILRTGTFTLLAYSLGISAEITSGCEASYWNAVWIGLLTNTISAVTFASSYESKHYISPQKFNFLQYTAYSLVPGIATVLLFNLYLHEPETKTKTQGLLNGRFSPYFAGDSYGLTYSVRF